MSAVVAVGRVVNVHSSPRGWYFTGGGPCITLIVLSTITSRTSGRYSSYIEVSYVTTGISTTSMFGTVPITGTWDPA